MGWAFYLGLGTALFTWLIPGITLTDRAAFLLKTEIWTSFIGFFATICFFIKPAYVLVKKKFDAGELDKEDDDETK